MNAEKGLYELGERFTTAASLREPDILRSQGREGTVLGEVTCPGVLLSLPWRATSRREKD